MKCLLSVFLFFIFAGLNQSAFAQTEVPAPNTAPIGPVVKLDLRLPGIGSESGNLAPLSPTRNVILYFFASDANSSDLSVKPAASFKTIAVYNPDTASPFFGSFVNQSIDLGKEIPDGKYQISFKVERALSHLVREKETDLGGKIFEIKNNRGKPIIIANKTVIVGDIYPSPLGDNIMDIKDHDALVGCFGSKADTQSYSDKFIADLDDNGVVDGTDYNLMSASFKILHSRGIPVPSIFADSQISQKPTPTKPQAKPTTQATEKKFSGGGNFFLVLFVILLAGAAGLIFFLKKRKQKLPVDKLSDKTGTMPDAPTEAKNFEEKIDKEFYVKKQADDTENNRIALSLTDDTGPTLGYFSGKDVKEGFAQVKGLMKKEGDKVFIEVTEIKPEEESTA